MARQPRQEPQGQPELPEILIAYMPPHDPERGRPRGQYGTFYGGKAVNFSAGHAYPVSRELAQLLRGVAAVDVHAGIMSADDDAACAFKFYSEEGWARFNGKLRAKREPIIYLEKPPEPAVQQAVKDIMPAVGDVERDEMDVPVDDDAPAEPPRLAVDQGLSDRNGGQPRRTGRRMTAAQEP